MAHAALVSFFLPFLLRLNDTHIVIYIYIYIYVSVWLFVRVCVVCLPRVRAQQVGIRFSLFTYNACVYLSVHFFFSVSVYQLYIDTASRRRRIENKIDSCCCCPRLVVHWRNECVLVGQVKTKDETVARNRSPKPQDKTRKNKTKY